MPFFFLKESSFPLFAWDGNCGRKLHVVETKIIYNLSISKAFFPYLQTREERVRIMELFSCYTIPGHRSKYGCNFFDL